MINSINESMNLRYLIIIFTDGAGNLNEEEVVNNIPAEKTTTSYPLGSIVDDGVRRSSHILNKRYMNVM